MVPLCGCVVSGIRRTTSWRVRGQWRSPTVMETKAAFCGEQLDSRRIQFDCHITVGPRDTITHFADLV